MPAGAMPGGPNQERGSGAMPDEPTTPPTTEPPATGDPAPTAPAATPPAPPEPASAPDLGDAGRKALDAERAARKALEAQVRELTPLAEQARKAAEASKTAEQKLTDKLTSTEQRAVTAELELARLQAALAKMPAGFDPGQLPDVLKFLTGATPDELAANAEQLFSLMAPATTTPPPAANGQQRPVEQLRPGAAPANTELPLPERIAAAERAGDLATAMRLKSVQLMGLAQGNT